jgi:hypothetical protein
VFQFFYLLLFSFASLLLLFSFLTSFHLRAAEWFNAQNRNPIISSSEPPKNPAPASTFFPLQPRPLTPTPHFISPTFPSTPSPLHTLTPSEVAMWLHEHNLGKYAETFEENEISGEILSQLSSQTLKSELGVSALGHRFVIMKAFGNKVFFARSLPGKNRENFRY